MEKIHHHLRKIRKQPEHIKRHILHAVTIILGIILILLWVYTLGNNISDEDKKIKTVNDLKPLSVLKENVVDGYNDLGNNSLDIQ